MRLRMSVLQSLVLLSLVAIHSVILVTDGPTFLRVVFVVYWVWQLFLRMLTAGGYTYIQYPSLPANFVSEITLQPRLCVGSPSLDLPLANRCCPLSSKAPTSFYWQSVSILRQSIQYCDHFDSCSQYHTVTSA